MADGRQRQPAVDKTPHTVPGDPAVLAALRQCAVPEPTDLEPKQPQRRMIHGHPVVAGVSMYHRLQPLAQFGDGFVHAPLELGFHLVQLRLQPLADRLPQHRVHSIASLLHTDMREAQEVERLRFPFTAPLPVVDRKRTEFQKLRLLGMQLQVELSHSRAEFCPKLIGIRFLLEWCLPLSPTASAPRSKFLSRLNTRPARSPVNASTLLLRAAPHDLGPLWVATSHAYDFCNHNTSPV
jgi:hypothetical protein